MNPIIIWLEEHFLLALSVALALSLLLCLVGALGAWRTGRRLGRPPRPILRFALSLASLGVGLVGAGVFSQGLTEVAPVARAQSRMLGQPAPPLDFTVVADGGAGSLADFRGQVVLVNLWATWCPPCRKEMPDLERLQRAYGRQGLAVVHISDEDDETVSGFLEEQTMSTTHGIASPIPWPEFGRPTSFIVDREGVIRRVIVGARDFAGFERAVRVFL